MSGAVAVDFFMLMLLLITTALLGLGLLLSGVGLLSAGAVTFCPAVPVPVVVGVGLVALGAMLVKLEGLGFIGVSGAGIKLLAGDPGETGARPPSLRIRELIASIAVRAARTAVSGPSALAKAVPIVVLAAAASPATEV